MIAGASVLASIALGVRATFGLYLDPISDMLGSGRGTFALTVAIQQIVWGLGQPVAGAVADRYGTGRVLAGGVGLFAIALLLMGQSTNALAIHATGGFLFGLAISAASFSVVLAAVGRAAAPERRSMALGIVSALGSVGQFVLVPVAQWLIDSVGWRDTVLVMGLIGLSMFAVIPPLRGTARDQQTETTTDEPARTLAEELRKARSSRSFLLLNLGFFVCGFHVTSIATHLPSYVTDLGLSSSLGATALALIGLFNIAGSLAAGVLGGRFSKTTILAIIYALRAIVITGFVLMPASGTATIVFAILMGMLWLATVPLTSGIVAQQFGTLHAGALFGIVFLSHQVGAFIGAWGGGLLVDRFDSYQPVWWMSVALGIVAMVAHLTLDDGPVPDPPPSAGAAARLPIAPAAGAAVLFVALGLTSMSDGADRATVRSTDGGSKIAFLYCPLHGEVALATQAESLGSGAGPPAAPSVGKSPSSQ